MTLFGFTHWRSHSYSGLDIKTRESQIDGFIGNIDTLSFSIGSSWLNRTKLNNELPYVRKEWLVYPNSIRDWS